MIEITENDLLIYLPHGSGIDGDWNIEEKGDYFKCENYYHCMNEHGYYDGYADFSIILFKKPEIMNKKFPVERQFESINFNLHFHGKTSQYKNKRYMLREYLEDTIHYALSDHFVEAIPISDEICKRNEIDAIRDND